MPLCIITRKPESVSDELAKAIGDHLRSAVASAMHVEENKAFHLDKHHVEVRIRDVGSLDINTNALAIEIIANHCPEREANLDSRVKMIHDSIWEMLPTTLGNDWYVWARLQVGSYKQN